MGFSKGAKSLLKVLVAIYVLVVILFLVKIFTAKEPKAKDAAVEDLITLSVKLHKQDPNVKVLSAKDASAIY
ncbi:MAG: hypothetical protein GXP25_04060, partial [Planctomycetes bacterium]|nr:hypothetical protein [Planctomycetota bacterium]